MKQLSKELLRLMKACNDAPEFESRNDFFELKEAILEKYATRLGYALQIFSSINISFRSKKTGAVFSKKYKVRPNGYTSLEIPQSTRFYRDEQEFEDSVCYLNSYMIGEHHHLLERFDLQGVIYYTPTPLYKYFVYLDAVGSRKTAANESILFEEKSANIKEQLYGFKNYQPVPPNVAELNYRKFYAEVEKCLGESFIDDSSGLPF